MRLKYFAILGIAFLLAGQAAIQAHHSFAAEYDSQKMMTVTGTITKVDWTNPHVYVHVAEKDASGKTITWSLEGYPINTMKRTGFARDLLKVGDTITITAYTSKDGSHTGAGREVTFSDGTKKFLGPVGAKMRTRIGISIVVAAVALVVTLPGDAQGQAKGKGKASAAAKANPDVKHAPIPRTADGKPDLTGTWQSGGVSINGEPGAPPLHPLPPIDNHPIRREPLVYKAPWEAKRGKLDAALDDPTLLCLLPGIPRISTMPMPLEIIQTPKEIAILYEAFRAWRRIPIDAKLRHPDDLTPTWMGDSVGHWDGDTLVVDVTGFNDKTWIAGGASIHSEAMHVVERYTLNDDGSLSFEAMVEDPEALEKPHYTGAIFRRPIDVRVEEYECIENNPDPAHMNKAAGRTN